LDDLKDAETRLAPPIKPLRTVVPGDRIWLKYSDLEKARYIRKHGKGLAWRHAFTVLGVKPHAVLLDIPQDGSVPDVLPWQSLRKCSFAAPFFHDPELPLPDVDEHALPLMPETLPPARSPTATGPINHDAALPIDDDPDGWHTWDSNALYDIESVVGAEPSGRGWKVHVKWVGYPTITTERLSSIMARVSDPRLLKEIEDHKAKYREQYPAAPSDVQPSDTSPTTSRPAPTRIQPARSSRIQSAFILAADECGEAPDLLGYACSTIRTRSSRCVQALRQLEDVPWQ
jgi:hypothetical protein